MNSARGENVMIIRPSNCIKKLSFRVFLCVLWFIPVFIILCWNPLFPLLVKDLESADLSRNQSQNQPAVKNSQNAVRDVSAKDSLLQHLVIDDDENESLLWKSQKKYDFSSKVETEIDISHFQKKSLEFKNPFFSSNLTFNKPDKQLKIFRLKQKLNSFNYGVEYRYMGSNIKNPGVHINMMDTKTNVVLEDELQGVEIWGAKKIGSISLKTFFSRFYDNLDRDPKQTRMLDNEYGLEMKYKMDSLPIYFSLSHSRVESKSAVEPNISKYHENQNETYGGSLYYYGGKAFNITVSSSYSPSQDMVHPNKETQSFWHEITTSIQPVSNVTITPTVSFGEYRYLWYGEHTENPSASLSFDFSRLFNAVDLSLWGGYSRMRDTDGSQDAGTLNTSIGVGWNAKHLFFPKMNYSLDLGYDQYDDKIYQNSSYNSLSTSFQVKFKF